MRNVYFYNACKIRLCVCRHLPKSHYVLANTDMLTYIIVCNTEEKSSLSLLVNN